MPRPAQSFRQILAIFMLFALVSRHAWAGEESADDAASNPQTAAETAAETPVKTESTREPFFSLGLPREPERPRSTVWPPVVSLLLPGFDQWWEGQHRQALAFGGFALSGVYVASSSFNRILERDSREIEIDSRDNDARTFLLGSQMYAAAGAMSAYSSFRSAVRTQQPVGAFQFLEREESVDELLAAPLDFSLLKRPTTYVPLALLAGAMIAVVAAEDPDPFRSNSLTGADAFFATSFSYLAGTNEEALFRGWIMPVYREAWGHDFWSNTAQATIFSLAHVTDSNPVPWPQFALGWYLGYLTQKNQWTLKESIFIHTWWDVLAFAGEYIRSAQTGKEATLRFPGIFVSF